MSIIFVEIYINKLYQWRNMGNNVWKCISLNFCKIKTIDEVGVDEIGVDQIGIDQMGSRRSGNKPLKL